MSDKLRRTYPINIIIGAGEQPDSSKISAISSQSRNALNIVERAIGDLWNQSGDSILAPGGSLTNALLLPNLARALGQSQLLGPRVHNLDGASGIAKYKDTITARDGVVGNNETSLKYRPVPSTSTLQASDFTVGTVDPGGALTTFKTAMDAVEAAGDWHVTADGKLVTATKIRSAELTYKPDLVPDIDDSAQSTVIPDPYTNGATYNGLKLSYANDTDNSLGYWLYLPPRRPLTSDRKISTSPNESGNEVDPTGPDRYFFQGTGFDASSDPHYRYKFPAEIQATLDGGTPLQLPDNFMYLVDRTTGSIVEGLVFSVDTTAPHLTLGRYVVKVQGTSLDQIVASDGTLVTPKATEASSAYKNRFLLICPGTSSSKAIASLVARSFGHKHNGADGSRRLLHSDLEGLFDNNVVNFGPSSFKGDDHPQYLHREGRSDSRDFYRNGLRGDLLLLSTTAGGLNDYYHVAAPSNKVAFGTTGKTLHYDNTSDALEITGADLRLASASRRLEFNDTAVYLDETRVKLMVLAAQSQKVFTGAVAGSRTGTGTFSTTTVGYTIPTGLTADVTYSFTGHWRRSGGGNMTSGDTIDLLDISSCSDTWARSGAVTESQTLSETLGATNVAAGSYSFGASAAIVTSLAPIVHLEGQITITLHFRIP